MSVRSASPVQDLWSSILDSVSSSRSIPAKNIVILGEPGTGKSTLARSLLKKVEEDGGGDFALGYGWADVKDEGEEDTLARLSVYTVPSSAAAHLSLVPHFLPPRTSLPHTLVMITLDWTRPWTFVSQLEDWLRWIERWAEGDGSRELEALREEGKERLQMHIQHYMDPTPTDSPNPSSLSTTLLPLGPGTLTHNSAGLPIIVVCTKADMIDEVQSSMAGSAALSGLSMAAMSKGNMWEERTDAVMQVLRTICLKYGAGLFYTTPTPQTLLVLRSYALHLLFTPTAVSPNDPPPRNPIPFAHRANTLDRDKIVIPAGWDSWGKIGILRDGFDARRWGEGFENDLAAIGPVSGPDSAKEWFKEIMARDEGIPQKANAPLLSPIPEQDFLSRHYEALQKDRDPRATFRQPVGAGGLPGAAPEAGVVGPMGSSSFLLPSVEKAMMEFEGEESRRPSVAARHELRIPPPLSTSYSATAPLYSARSHPSPAISPPLDTSPTGQTTQHEVLQNFFQSLLGPNRRDAPPGITGRAPPPLRPPQDPPPESVNGDI